MNRKYTIEEFEQVVKLLRQNFENVALTTDIIVGFPDESEEEFEETYEFLKKIKFMKMHVFKYSPREGTVASKMKNQIDENIKELRSSKLIELSNKNEEEFLSNYIGKKLEVLIENKENGVWKGHSKNYIVVNVKDRLCANVIKNIKIVECSNGELNGQVIKM